jgi:molybdate transport system substrate-binding protein
VRRALAVAVGLALAATGCGKPPTPDRDNGGKITVVADASLAGVFQALEPAFERENPGTDLIFGYAAATLATQRINAGAPADVFATGAATMAQVKGAKPELLAHNQLVIAVGPNNPLKIKSLADLATRKVAICVTAAPCGTAAGALLGKSGVTLTGSVVVDDVKAAMDKLTLGEVDAALVFRTDALAAIGQVDAVEFAESAQAVADFMAAVLPASANPAGAKAFLAFLTSARGRVAFTDAGFVLP